MRTFFPGLSIALLATSVSAYAEPETGSRLDKAPGSLVYSEETPVVAQFVNRFSRCVASASSTSSHPARWRLPFVATRRLPGSPTSR